VTATEKWSEASCLDPVLGWLKGYFALGERGHGIGITGLRWIGALFDLAVGWNLGEEELGGGKWSGESWGLGKRGSGETLVLAASLTDHLVGRVEGLHVKRSDVQLVQGPGQEHTLVGVGSCAGAVG
jgi:hypothetical protein